MSTPSLTLLCCSREVSLPAQGDPPVRRQSSQRCLLFWAGERQQLRQWKGRASRLDILWGQHLLARSPRETLHVEGNQCFLPPNVFPYKPQVFFTAVTALQYMNPSPEAQSSGRFALGHSRDLGTWYFMSIDRNLSCQSRNRLLFIASEFQHNSTVRAVSRVLPAVRFCI